MMKTSLTRFTFLDPNLTGFERAYQGVLPPYRVMQVVDRRVVSHATVRERDSQTEGILIATGPHGGYAAEDYALYVGGRDGGECKKWYINPWRVSKEGPYSVSVDGKEMSEVQAAAP